MTTTETGIVELLACPFCGGPAAAQQYRSRNWGVGCVSHECQCTLTAEAYGTSRKRAIAAWNARAAIAAMPDSIQLLQTMAGALEAADELIEAMQHQARQYVEPSGYTSFDRKRIAFEYDQEAKDSLFTGDIIYLLDGPEQRAAQAKINAALAQFRAQEQRS